MTERKELLVEAAWDVARLAGSIALKYFGEDVGVESKRDGSPVTIADRSAEKAAREWIATRFPDDGVVGEEFGVTNADAKRRWIIDPIDGTRSFVRGVPLWGTLIAVCNEQNVLASAVFFPALDESMAAGTGVGCWWNGRQSRVSTVARIEEAVVVTTDERFTARPDRREGWTRLTSRAALSRSWGDCYGYLLVATGRAEVMVDGVANEWDTAPVQLCVVESGGVFTSWEGRPTAFGGSAIATNAALAFEARQLIQGTAT